MTFSSRFFTLDFLFEFSLGARFQKFDDFVNSFYIVSERHVTILRHTKVTKLSEDEIVDWSFDAESRSISLEAGSVTGAVLQLFCFAIILGVR